VDLDLVKLRSFVAVAETLHFGRAAEQLHLAQPALSRQIQTLERHLGTPLLDRDRRSVSLTPAGRQLFEDAGPLLAAAEAARRRVQRAARGADRLVVGFRTGVLPTAAVRRFTAAHPEFTVDVIRLEWDEQEDAIRTGRVDIAFVRRPIDERAIRLTPLYAEPRLVALPAEHPLARSATLTTRELAGERYLKYLQPVQGADGRTMRLRGVEEKLEYVAAGHGIILLPRSATEHFRRPDVVYVPVTDAEPDEVLLAYEGSRRSKALFAFVEAALVSRRDPHDDLQQTT
jgi:DNA-binding transcriptional LysR family regulator